MNLELILAKLEFVQNEELKDVDYNSPEWKELYEYEQSLNVPSPNNPPWNSWMALLVWLVSVVSIVVLPFLFLIPFLLMKNVNLSDQSALSDLLIKDPNAIILNIAAIFPAHLLTLLGAWLIVTRYRQFSFFEMLGWRWGGFKFWHGFLILVGFFIVAMVVSNFFPEQENELTQILKSSRTATILVAIMATFTAPIVEEIVYRGVLYSAFQRAFGVTAAVVSVTFLFAVIHVPQYYPSYSTIILIFLLSLILTLIRVRTKNLLPCIALHFAFNGIQSVILIAEPYLPKSPTEVQEIPNFIIRLLT
ncbi:hypothetical protein BH10ACI1_BH10ACI1_13540 [soil metagenome]